MVTEVRRTQGGPRFFRDGTEIPAVFCSVQRPQMRRFIDAGFRVFDTHPYVPHGWVGPGQYDYRSTDAFIEDYLRQKPDALLILRFWMGYPLRYEGTYNPTERFWWNEAHPAEIIRTMRGEGSAPEAGQQVRQSPSFASLPWRREAGEALSRAIQHIEEAYGDRVFAYVPGGGPCGEWFHWFAYYDSSNADPELLDDYSEPMRQAFRRWARESYPTVGELNAAWQTHLASHDEVELPGVRERLSAREGVLRNPTTERRLIDFYRCYNREVADTLLAWAEQAKQASGRRKAILVFYGYLWHHQEGVVISRSGHVDLDAVLASPSVDALVAPFHYSFRQLDGVITGQAPVNGALARGKQYVHELDGSTHCESCWPCPGHHNPSSTAESVELQRRDLSRVLTQGSAAWIMDLVPGMYDDPELVAATKRNLAALEGHLTAARLPNRQIAVVLAPDDVLHYREGEALLAPLVSMFKQFQLARMGADFDDYILPDLERLDPAETARYRLWIFPSLVHPSAGEMELIRRHCTRAGNVVLWCYAPGLLGERGLDPDGVRRLTGMRVGYTMEPGELSVRLIPSGHPAVARARVGLEYGTCGDLSPDDIKYHAALGRYPTSAQGFRVAPRPWIEEGEPLGNLTGDLEGKVGLAVADLGTWKSVLSVAPLCDREILRSLAAYAGCHVTTAFPGQVMHCGGYLAFFSHADGTCTLLLPRAARVVDVWSGKVLAERSERIELPVRRNSSHLLWLS